MAAMSTVAARAEVPWPRDAGKCRMLKPEAPDRREGVSQGRVRMRGGEGGQRGQRFEVEESRYYIGRL